MTVLEKRGASAFMSPHYRSQPAVLSLPQSLTVSFHAVLMKQEPAWTIIIPCSLDCHPDQFPRVSLSSSPDTGQILKIKLLKY